MMTKKEREHTKTTISLAPLTVDEALAALLHTLRLRQRRRSRRSAQRRQKSDDCQTHVVVGGLTPLLVALIRGDDLGSRKPAETGERSEPPSQRIQRR
jgi:hypothetical protein